MLNLMLWAAREASTPASTSLLQILITPSEGITQLLNDVGTSIVERIGADSDATEVRILLQHFNELRTKGEHRCDILALHHHLLHGVPLDRAYHLLLVVALLSEVSHENLCEPPQHDGDR